MNPRGKPLTAHDLDSLTEIRYGLGGIYELCRGKYGTPECIYALISILLDRVEAVFDDFHGRFVEAIPGGEDEVDLLTRAELVICGLNDLPEDQRLEMRRRLATHLDQVEKDAGQKS